MDRAEAKSFLLKIKKEIPSLSIIRVEYEGSGDSFGDFYSYNYKQIEPKELNIENIYTDKESFSSFKLLTNSEIGDLLIGGLDIDDLLWYALNSSEADFNNGGSQGTITIDLVKLTIDVDNNYKSEDYFNEGGVFLKLDEDEEEEEE